MGSCTCTGTLIASESAEDMLMLSQPCSTQGRYTLTWQHCRGHSLAL